jgi:hypothetical protein
MRGTWKMAESTRTVERRKNPRIPVKSRGDAMLFGSDFAKGVQILDLSEGGVAFRYVAGCEQVEGPLELDILWEHVDVFILKLKIRVVSDFHIPNEYLLGVIPVRRCSASFVDLTEDQRSKLNHFIEQRRPGEANAQQAQVVHQTVRYQEADPWTAV